MILEVTFFANQFLLQYNYNPSLWSVTGEDFKWTGFSDQVPVVFC